MDLAALLSDRPHIPAPLKGLDVRRISRDDLPALRVSGCSIVLLFDDALTLLRPDPVRAAVPPGAEVWLCPADVSTSCLVDWFQAGFGEVLTLHQVASRLRRAAAGRRRPRIPPSAWLPPIVRAVAELEPALRLVQQLERPHSVAEWARRLSWSRQRLWRVCMASLRRSPSQVLWLYVEAVVRQGRRRGCSEDTVAEWVGYADASALSHAFRRRGKQVPPRGCRLDARDSQLRDKSHGPADR